MEWLSHNDWAEDGRSIRGISTHLAEHGIDQSDCCCILAKHIISHNSHPYLQKSDLSVEKGGPVGLSDVYWPFGGLDQRCGLKKVTFYVSEGAAIE